MFVKFCIRTYDWFHKAFLVKQQFSLHHPKTRCSFSTTSDPVKKSTWKHKHQKTVTETYIKCEWEHLSNTVRDSVQLFFIQRESGKLTHNIQNCWFCFFLEMGRIPF